MIPRLVLIATTTFLCFLAADVEACRWRLCRPCRCVCICTSSDSNNGENSAEPTLDSLPDPLPELNPLPEDFAVEARNRLFAVRAWTHRDGRSLQGRCVAISRESARLMVDGLLYNVPLSSFCDQDRGELAEVAATAGEEELLYVGLPAAPIEREWSDASGRTVQAQLIGADEQVALLAVDGQVYSLPVSRFSDEDQSVVRSLHTGLLLAVTGK